jgi:ubiquinone/menaquinone biosynthesis C-methylase UbiE
MESQREVWDCIARPWKTFRVKIPEEVRDFLKNKKGDVLDLGCGTGRNFVKIDGTIYGVDFSENMLRHARDFADKNKINVRLINSRAEKLPFNGDFFDAGIYFAVLHCLESAKDREASLKELLRVLKPGSEALVAVWDYNQEKFKGKKKEEYFPWKHEGKEHMRYYYLFDKEELGELLRKVGFNVLRIANRENSDGLYSNKNIMAVVKKPLTS